VRETLLGLKEWLCT